MLLSCTKPGMPWQFLLGHNNYQQFHNLRGSQGRLCPLLCSLKNWGSFKIMINMLGLSIAKLKLASLLTLLVFVNFISCEQLYYLTYTVYMD